MSDLEPFETESLEIKPLETESLAVTSKYGNIVRGMRKELTYTEIPITVKDELKDICKPKRFISTKDCKLDPSVFAYHLLGITPYAYQYMMFEHIRKGKKRIIFISSRQIGKTFSIDITALHSAYYNTMPSGVHKNTKVIIISKSENQAKKIIHEIKNLIALGDRNFAIRTNNKCQEVLSRELAPGQPQTATQITFRNGSSIKSLSPTDSARGYTADLLILDEAAYIDEELFYDVLEPMTSAVDGAILMASTPSGCQGLGYKIFDPENQRDNNPYARLWIPWWYCENPVQKAKIEEKREQWIAEGKIRNFQQEYEAKFTVAESNFFDAQKVDESVDESMTHVLEWHSEPCSLGLDYGWKSSHTAITISSKGEDGIVRERLHHAYPTDGSDVNVLEDVEGLMKRFNIKHIVPDDASMGYLTNQKMINKGWPVFLFNFRTDQNTSERNRGYYILRSSLYQGKVKITKNKELIREMKQLLEIKKQVNVSIKAPPGENDDRCFVKGTKILTDNGQVSIEKVKMGDFVMTRGGFKKVLQTHCNLTDRNNIISKIGLTGTKSHPVIVSSGTKKLINLNESDTLYIWNEKQSFIKESSIIDIQNLKIGLIESIIGAIQHGRVLQNLCIGKSGKIILGKSQNGISSTIKTIIHLIMPLKIWNVFPGKNMQPNIGRKRKVNGQGKILMKMQGLRQSNGISQRKGWHGIRNILNILSEIPKNISIIVLYVVKSLRALGSRLLDFVQENVGIKNISRVVDVLQHVRDVGKKRRVYNLTVEDCNEYFANNILVHNCDSLLMSVYPFLVEEDDGGDLIAPLTGKMDEFDKRLQNPRYDPEWASMMGQER